MLCDGCRVLRWLFYMECKLALFVSMPIWHAVVESFMERRTALLCFGCVLSFVVFVVAEQFAKDLFGARWFYFLFSRGVIQKKPGLLPGFFYREGVTYCSLLASGAGAAYVRAASSLSNI